MTCLAIIEPGPNNFSAYVPDLPGCTSARNTYEEAIEGIHEAIEGRLEVMREYGEPVPEPASQAALIDVAIAV